MIACRIFSVISGRTVLRLIYNAATRRYCAVDSHGSCDNLGAFASLYAAHGADAHLFQRRVIQLASIVLFHLPSESDESRPVNKNVQLLMDRLIVVNLGPTEAQSPNGPA